jgi:hypothetical protein
MPPKATPKRHPLNQSRLYAVQSRAKLAALFGLTRETLDEVLAMERPYSNRSIEVERNGKTKTRHIQEPRTRLRPIHATVKNMLSRIEPPGFLFCPVKRRDYVMNAAQHVSSREVWTVDIKDYFPSTPRRRVFWFFHHFMRCSSDVASILAQLLTIDEHLAIGSTVSPILSFFAFYDMWLDIAAIAREAGCMLTVYIDDITLSGSAVPESVAWAVRKEIHKRGLQYHKERHYAGRYSEVTGVLMRDGKLVVPNRQLKKAHDVRLKLASASDPGDMVQLKAVLHGLKEQRKQVESTRVRETW